MNKRISNFKLFEALSKYDEYMGRLLHLYGSIPVPKEKSSIVIKKIILSTNDNQFYRLGEDVHLNHIMIHDKVRFKDYFNFEGLLCGLFGGNLASRGLKYDLTINRKRYSVKFIDNSTKAPEIGSYRALKDEYIGDEIIENGGLTRIFQSDDEKLKEDLWIKISEKIDGWIIAYPDDSKNPSQILVNLIPKNSMKSLLFKGFVVAPKAGLERGIFSLALSGKFKYVDDENIKKFSIHLPVLTIYELKKIIKNPDEETWAEIVFGEYGSKIRPDVLRYIHKNKEDIGSKLINLPN